MVLSVWEHACLVYASSTTVTQYTTYIPGDTRASITRSRSERIAFANVPTGVKARKAFPIENDGTISRLIVKRGSFQGGKSQDLPTLCESFMICNALTFKRMKGPRVRDRRFFSRPYRCTVNYSAYIIVRWDKIFNIFQTVFGSE